jgi:soluble lytic murein transglycosylase-like protein
MSAARTTSSRTSSSESSRTDGPRRSGPWAERILLSPFLLALLALLAAPEPPVSTAAPPLPALRRSFAGAAAALGRSNGVAPPLDGTPLGLPGLGPWLGLASGLGAGRTTVAALVTFAAAQPDEVLAREALGDAARLATSQAERRSVRAALEAWPEPDLRHARAVIARALALARATESRDAGRARLAALGGVWPDAPERAADLFDETDRAAFDAAMKTAPPAARAARARTVAARDPKQAAMLLKSLGAAPPAEVRVLAAEAWLAAGSPKDARRLLALGPPAGIGDSEAIHRAALAWLAEARVLAPAPARGARRRRGRNTAALRTPPALSRAQRAAADARLAELPSLLARPMGDEDRRRILENGVRLARRAGRSEQARAFLPPLLDIDPANDAGAAEAFRETFDLYAAGRWADAAHAFDEQAGLYREVTARRRATYWAAKSKERLGDTAGARALYANLVPGAAPDLYARWAAAALGMSVAPPPTAASEDASAESETPLAPSRELMLCGFPDLAGDAAELEGTLDPVFAARVAAGTGDYRRAATLLKRRFPELGTPEEGAVPAEARRAYYPVAHADIVAAEALRAGVPASLLFGVIRQESVFTADVRSKAGALGLMQVMPATGRTLFRRENGGKGRPDLKDPGENVRLGALYLRDLLAEFHGDTASAVAAYNAGPGRVRSWKKAAGALPSDEFLESIPIAETRVYVKRVLYFQGAYAALYGLPLDTQAPHLETRASPLP